MRDEELLRSVQGARNGREEAFRALDRTPPAPPAAATSACGLRPAKTRKTWYRRPSRGSFEVSEGSRTRKVSGRGSSRSRANVRRTSEERRRREPAPIRTARSEEIADPATPDRLEEAQLDRARRETLRDGMRHLPARQRQCLALQVRDGLSYEEIAETLRLSVNTVRNHLAAARESLRARSAMKSEESRRA